MASAVPTPATETQAVAEARRSEAGLLVNVDVPDIEAGIAFYTTALGLSLGRRFDDDFVELIGREAPIYLLKKDEGTSIGPAGGDTRRYSRHWSPVHLDFAVDDIEVARALVLAAGAVQEGETCDAPYGKLAMFADPFGHGFCLIEFSKEGYDAILP
jgi:catechol 2,3-dioxygenase-like lactoylglutathione lyase family enzyme